MLRTIRLTHLAAAAAALLITSACGPGVSIGVNTAPDLKPAAYRTFTWEIPDQFPTGDARLDNNPFFIRELQNAVATQLTQRGLKEAATGDLAVHFHATVRDRIDYYELDRRAGYDQTPGAPNVGTYRFEEGTILVDVAERTTKKLIWRGWMQTDLSGTIGDNARMGERVRTGMKLLFKFPRRWSRSNNHDKNE